MGLLFESIIQFRNLTFCTIQFYVIGGLCPISKLPGEKTRTIDRSWIMGQCKEQDSPDWTMSVLIDGRYTGIEIPAAALLHCSRIVFRLVVIDANGTEAFCVQGVLENCSDYLLSYKYFGCMRNFFWNRRPSFEIGRSDSSVATKLRQIESSFGKGKQQNAGMLPPPPSPDTDCRFKK